MGRFMSGLLVLMLLLIPAPAGAGADDRAEAETSAPAARPPLPPQPEKKLRLIYVEGGAFKDYYLTLVGLAHGLARLGLIDNGQIPFDPNGEDTEALWRWLSQEAGGDYLEFLPDGHYSANWDEGLRRENKRRVLGRLKNIGDVDLIWASGTWAGQDLATDEHDTFVLSSNATAPVLAGISRTLTDSGRDHVHIQVEADRQERQLRIFYDIFKFKRLGVPMDSSESGRQSLGMDIIENMAEEMGFEIVPCVRDLDIADQDLSFKNLMECLPSLSRDSDAVFLTFNNGMQEAHMAEILAPIIEYKRPSFSQLGPVETSLGVLMSLGQDNYEASGEFQAGVIEAVLNGRKPREIDQIFNSPLTMALNLAMARAIGWEPPFDLLVTMDEIYQDLAR